MRVDDQHLIPTSLQSSILFTSIQNQSLTLILQPLPKGLDVVLFSLAAFPGREWMVKALNSDAKHSSSAQGWSK